MTILSLHLLVMGAFTLITAAFLALLTGTRPRLHARGVGWLCREWLATALIVALRSLYPCDRPPRAGRVPPRPDPRAPPLPGAAALPVLLVPGYSLSRNSFAVLAFWLRRHGFAWVHAINHRPLSAPIPVFAHQLGREVERLCAASAAGRVDIVAHSMGGLVAAWYVQHLGGRGRVRRIVTLGTPWRGSAAAVFAIGRQGLDLMPGSEIVAGLARLPAGVTSLWSRQDAIVLPPDNAVHPDARMVELPWTGHHMLLLRPAALEAILDALVRPGEPAAAGDDSLRGPSPA